MLNLCAAVNLGSSERDSFAAADEIRSQSAAGRRQRLEAFCFDGLPGFDRVIAPEHFRSPGGIRTFQNTSGSGTSARMDQFQLEGSADISREFLIPDDSPALFTAVFHESLGELIGRAESLTCTGCHAVNGGSHVRPDRTLSPAMRDAFIPARMEILRRFLQSK